MVGLFQFYKENLYYVIFIAKELKIVINIFMIYKKN